MFSQFRHTLVPCIKAICVLGLCSAYSASIGAEESPDESVKEIPQSDTQSELRNPMLELVIPDADRTQERFHNSIYQQLWDGPAFERYRNKFIEEKDKAFAKTLAKDAIDLHTLIDNFESAGARLLALDSNDPALSDFHTFINFKENGAKEIMELTLLDGAIPTEVEGADQAYISDDGGITLARFDKTLVFADSENVSLPAMITGVESDIELSISFKELSSAWVDLLYNTAPIPPPIDKDKFKSIVGQYDQFNYAATIQEKGIFEEIQYVGPLHSGMQAIDHEILKRLPGNAIAVAATAFKGEDMWDYHMKPMLEIAAEAKPEQTAEQIITQVNNMLSMFGIDVGVEDVVKGIDGTAFICVTPAVPFPAPSIGIPRSKNLDTFISAILMARFNIIAPTEGKIESIQIQPMMPALLLSLSASHWMISTDHNFTTQWLNGQSSGWSSSETGKAVLEKADDNTYLIAAADIKQLTAIGQGLMGLAAMGAKGDDMKHVQAASTLLQRLNSMAEPAWLWGSQTGNDYKIEAYSLTGSLPLIAIPALVAKQQQDQRRERRDQWRDAREAEQKRAEEMNQEPDSVDDL